MSTSDAIKALRDEAAAKIKEAEAIEAKTKAFPDLRKYTGRWNKVAYCSRSVNEKADKYDTRHNCGCCNDSPLEVWPYLETPVGRIYSDPPSFMIGERDWDGGDTSYPGWREKLREVGINDALISQMAFLLKDECEDKGEDDVAS